MEAQCFQLILCLYSGFSAVVSGAHLLKSNRTRATVELSLGKKIKSRLFAIILAESYDFLYTRVTQAHLQKDEHTLSARFKTDRKIPFQREGTHYLWAKTGRKDHLGQKIDGTIQWTLSAL